MKIVDRIKKAGIIKKILTAEYSLRTLIFGFFSLLASTAFMVFNLVYGVIYSSVWHYSMAGYCLALILFRGYVILSTLMMTKKRIMGEMDKDGYEKGKWKINLISGLFLLLVELLMGVAITNLMLSPNIQVKSPILAIATATYTTIKMTFAIRNLIKANKNGNPITQSLRILNFADALMSVVSLTYSLLMTFGEGGEDYIAMESTVGFFAVAIVLAMAIYTIIMSSKNLLKMKKGEITYSPDVIDE